MAYTQQFLARVAAAETESELRDLLNYAETGELAAAIVLRGKEIEAERDNDPEIEGSRAWHEVNGQFGVGA